MVTKDLQTLNLKLDQVVFIFRYCLFVGKKLVTLNISFIIFWGVKMCDKMTISAYILKIVEKDPFLRLQMRTKEMFNPRQFNPYK